MLTRQEQYRRRLIIKAAHFDIYNAERLAQVRRSFAEHGDQKSPEHRALLPYFLSHPEARRFVPAAVGLVAVDNVGRDFEPRWGAYLDDNSGEHARLHAHILAFGLSEVSSIPHHVSYMGDGWCAQVAPEDLHGMAQTFRDLRDAGMWVKA
jgi:hypothetical protein